MSSNRYVLAEPNIRRKSGACFVTTLFLNKPPRACHVTLITRPVSFSNSALITCSSCPGAVWRPAGRNMNLMVCPFLIWHGMILLLMYMFTVCANLCSLVGLCLASRHH